MRNTKQPPSKSKQRLLRAAEKLFADHGFDVVSVRDVTKLAKANVAAINYHFGSRESMVTRVVDHYVGRINEARVARLEVLERQAGSGVVSVEEVIEAFVLPVFDGAADSGLPEQRYLKLVGRILARGEESLSDGLVGQMKSINDRFTQLLESGLPEVEFGELIWRSRFMNGALIDLLMNQETLHSTEFESKPVEDGVARLICFSAAGFRAGLISKPEPKPKPKPESKPKPEVKRGPQGTFEF